MNSTQTAIAIAGGMAAYGLLKGVALNRTEPRPEQPGRALIKSLVVAPVFEEISYRKNLGAGLGELAGDNLGPMAASAAFAVGHTKPGAPLSENFLWAVDAFLGGLVYHYCYEQAGLWGAIATHAAHNLGVNLGAYALRPPSSHI